jgi:superfamily II DNA or RNA helicase
VFRFGLRDALVNGFLTPYSYHPVLVNLDEDEETEYHLLSEKIARLTFMAGDEDDNCSPLSHLLQKRARLVGAASQKLPLLRDLLAQTPIESHALFYCGDGQTECEVTHAEVRQVDAVVGLLTSQFGYRVHRFTATEDRQTREHLISAFESGQLQGLVAIRCLDEGVDVPATRTAFILASTTNPRQAIQRLGRVLRRAEGKECATVYDFLVVPRDDPGNLPDDVFNVERRLLKRELTRARRFASLALNGAEAMACLLPLESRYHLLGE